VSDNNGVRNFIALALASASNDPEEFGQVVEAIIAEERKTVMTDTVKCPGLRPADSGDPLNLMWRLIGSLKEGQSIMASARALEPVVEATLVGPEGSRYSPRYIVSERVAACFDVLRAISEGRPVQMKVQSKWCNAGDSAVLIAIYTGMAPEGARVKPNTIEINGVELLAPHRLYLVPGERYYVVTPLFPNGYEARQWTGTNEECAWVDRGLVHLDKATAKAHAAAICKASGGVL